MTMELGCSEVPLSQKKTMEEIYVIKVRSKPSPTRLFPSERRYSAITVGGLGAVHILLGSTCLLLGGLNMGTASIFHIWATKCGGGIWLGIASYVAGAAGILAWRRWYVDNNIRWFFIASSIAGFVAVICIALTAASLAVAHESRSYSHRSAILPERSTEITHQELSLNSETYPITDVPSRIHERITLTTVDHISVVDNSNVSQRNKRTADEEFSSGEQISGNIHPDFVDVDNFKEHKDSFILDKKEIGTVVSINILVAATLELAWSILSAKIAWKGMKNTYPGDVNEKTDIEYNSAEIKKQESMSSSAAERKPDILCNHARKSSVNQESVSVIEGPCLPTEESSMEYQERVRRFLESHKLGS